MEDERMVKYLCAIICLAAQFAFAQFTMADAKLIDPFPCSYLNVAARNRVLEGFDIKLTGFENSGQGYSGGTSNRWTAYNQGTTKCNPAFDITAFTTNKPPGSCDQAFLCTPGTDGVEGHYTYDFGYTNVLTGKTNYCSFYFMCTSVPAAGDYYYWMSINDSDTTLPFEGLRIQRASATTFTIRWAASSSITLTVGTWYNIRVMFGPNGAGNSSACYVWTGGNGGGPGCEPGSCNYVGAFSFDALKRNVRYLMFGAIYDVETADNVQWVVDGVSWYQFP